VNLVHFETVRRGIVSEYFEVRILETSVVQNLRSGLVAVELNVPVILKLKIRSLTLLLPQVSPQ
jgi:hypothetical protein